jgi:hypothetical protein
MHPLAALDGDAGETARLVLLPPGPAEPELELRVREEDPGPGGDRRRVAIQGDGRAPDRLGDRTGKVVRDDPALADVRDHRVEVDVLIVGTLLGLGRRGEERLGKTVALAQTGRQPDATDRTARLVLLPAGTGEVPADDGLDRDDRGGLADHQPSAQLVG